jgi:SAM-dependent methyltransferase
LTPGVSVVVPCFNLGHLLEEAVDSVLSQTYTDYEIIVVDDGSEDRTTREVLRGLPARGVAIIRGPHQGVSRTRNLGLEQAKGKYVSFLDGDDRLAPMFLEHTTALLDLDPRLGFASCWLRAFGETSFRWEPERCRFPWLLAEDTVCTAALTRRSALLDVGGYDDDPRLEGFEDWDLAISLVARGHYGEIVREPLFLYRQRPGSLTSWCLSPANHMKVFARLLDKYADVYQVHAEGVANAIGARIAEFEASWPGGAPPRPDVTSGAGNWRSTLFALERHRRELEQESSRRFGPVPVTGVDPIDWGSLRSTQPVSETWGLDRGTAVDRYYIQQFLSDHADLIRGDVLEVKDPGYTHQFGVTARSATVVDVDESNARATLFADLSGTEALPPASFDCVVMTQTLHLIYDVASVLENLRRALRPGGSLLVTLPCLSRIDYELGLDNDFWRFTPAAARRLFVPLFGAEDVSITAFGNVLADTAFLQGAAAEDLTAAELDVVEPYFPLLVAVCARQPGAQSASASSPARHVTGCVDEVSCRRVLGWAYNAAVPEQRLHLELRSDDELVATTWADRPRDDLAEAGIADGRVAFAFDLTEPIHDAKLVVTASGESVPLPGPAANPSCICELVALNVATRLEFHVDSPGSGQTLDFPRAELLGWGMCATAPVTSIELSHDGTVFRAVAVDRPRPDLAAAFPDRPWAGTAGFSAQLSLLAMSREFHIELTAVLADGSRVAMQTLAGAAPAPAPHTVVVLETQRDELPLDSATFAQDTPPERVLVIGGEAPPEHPGMVAAAGVNVALDNREAMVWLADGRAEVSADFLSTAAALLREDSTLAFVTAGPAAARDHGLSTVLSGARLGSTILFRGAAIANVGGADQAAPGVPVAEWDLAVRIVAAGGRGGTVASAPDAAVTIPERAGEDGVRWMFAKHANLYSQNLKQVLLAEEAHLQSLLLGNQNRERTVETELRPRLRARRRERDRIGAKLRPEFAARAARWGDLGGLEPLSPVWGADRGVCVDRHYIEQFVERHAGDIGGDVLAFPDAIYVRRYGGDRVSHCDVYDYDATNPAATIVGTPAELARVSDRRYDCVLLPHLLHMTANPAAALTASAQLLKPGGVLLASVPTVSRLDPERPHLDAWRFTPTVVAEMLSAAFDPTAIDVTGWGNRTAIVAFLTGVAAQEVPPDQLDRHDVDHPLVVTARAFAAPLPTESEE